MSYKTILALIQSKADIERVLDCVVPLATRFDGHLVGIHSEPMPIAYATPMGFPDTTYLTANSELNRERAAELAEIYNERTRRDGVSAEWHAMESFSGDASVSSLHVARTCDLVVVQQSDPNEESTSLTNVEAFLFDSGRPVLFIPYAMDVDTRFSRILVAWNGTPEAARATFDALPFITAADSVEILCVDPRSDARQDGAVAAAGIAATLARHGANVTVSSQKSEGLSAGEVIENRIAETGAQLLVMGAYSQNWLKEFFFGGATRTLLESMPAATLMSR